MGCIAPCWTPLPMNLCQICEISYEFSTSLSSLHKYGNIVILTKFTTLTAPEVVILIIFGAFSDENFLKMKRAMGGRSQP